MEYIRIHPRGWKMRWELAQRLCDLGFLKEAEEQLLAAISRQPNKAEIWVDLGRVYGLMGRKEEARAAFEKALQWARDEKSRRHILSLIEA